MNAEPNPHLIAPPAERAERIQALCKYCHENISYLGPKAEKCFSKKCRRAYEKETRELADQHQLVSPTGDTPTRLCEFCEVDISSSNSQAVRCASTVCTRAYQKKYRANNKGKYRNPHQTCTSCEGSVSSYPIHTERCLEAECWSGNVYEMLAQWRSALPVREQRIVDWCLSIPPGEKPSTDRVTNTWGIGRERVRQLRKGLLRQLAQLAASPAGAPIRQACAVITRDCAEPDGDPLPFPVTEQNQFHFLLLRLGKTLQIRTDDQSVSHPDGNSAGTVAA